MQKARVIPRQWRVERDGSDVLVKVDGTTLVTIHYDYRYIDNARQWDLAVGIAQMLGTHGVDTLTVSGSGP